MANLDRKKHYKKYKCPWPNCGQEFEAHAPGIVGEGKKAVGSQVKCPGCSNYLKN